MFGHHKSLITLLVCCSWISAVHGTQDIFFNDDINQLLDLDVLLSRNSRVAIGNDEGLACERPEYYYICEEPPETVPPEVRRSCNFRNVRYHEQVFRWVAGWGCLLYTYDSLFIGGVNTVNISASCRYGNWAAPCLEIAKEDGSCGCFPFDPALEEVANAIRNALIPSAHGRWERCFYQAVDCCTEYMVQDTNFTEPGKCETTFDAWTCWHSADAGTVASQVCSEFAYSGSGPSCNHFSSKDCFANGTWNIQTDYTGCTITSRFLRRYRFHIIMLSISIASCLPAVFIFFFYKRLRITRVALHRNLLIAIILRNVFVIISRTEIYFDELKSYGDTAMSRHGVACRVLAIAERVAANAVFVCMLLEGIYLHRLIVAVFRKKLNIKLLYGIGAVIAIVPAAAWAAVMGTYNDHSCWLVYTLSHVQWIIDAPRVAILLINTVLFIDVLRVLLTKIRNAENANQLSTTKATLFLMPIFGIQFLLTAFRPNTTNCTGEEIYYYVTYTVEGLQGFIVAMLYCYVNKEVRMLIRATYKKTENAFVSRVRGDNGYSRKSLGPNSERRLTFSTGLQASQADDENDKSTNVPPKIHVAEIISIQASEKLAEILEPVYETIENGVTNKGYNSLERSDADKDSGSDADRDSGIIRNRDSKVEDCYGFTNASSVSIECQDWIRRPSATSSNAYPSSLNEYDPEETSNDSKLDVYENPGNVSAQNNEDKKVSEENYTNTSNKLKPDVNITKTEDSQPDDDSQYEDCENMYDEIMQYIENNEINDITLDPNRLMPNRKNEEKIIFVDE